MRIIDSKGRLFGLINLLDLLIVVVIVTLASTVAINLLTKVDSKKTGQEVWVKVLYRVPNEVAKNTKILRQGDRVLVGNAVVEQVLEVRPVITDNGKETTYSDLVILIRANCVLLNNEYYCANMPIKVNSSLTISNPAYIFSNGVIIDIDVR